MQHIKNYFWLGPVWLLDQDFDEMFAPPLSYQMGEGYQTPKGLGNDGKQVPRGHAGKDTGAYSHEKYLRIKARRKAVREITSIERENAYLRAVIAELENEALSRELRDLWL